MSSKGKRWSVPHRQISKSEIRQIENMIKAGRSVSDVGKAIGKTDKRVRDIIHQHTQGIRRLRANQA